MSVSSLSNYASALNLSTLYGSQGINSLTTESQSGDLGIGSLRPPDSADFSTISDIYSKLQQLAESDPDKLKEVCGDIAEQLKSAAEEQSGPQAQMLSDLADKFQNVAEGGDVSQLQPPPPPPPPSSAGSVQGMLDSYTQQQSSTSLTEFLQENSTSTDSTEQTDMSQLMANILAQINQALDQTVS